jgi:hypothetical protein
MGYKWSALATGVESVNDPKHRIYDTFRDFI